MANFLQIMQVLNSLGSNIINAIDMQHKYKDTIRTNEYNNWMKIQNEKVKTDVGIKNDENNKGLTDAETKLKQSMDYLSSYNVTRDLYASKVSEQFRTKEYQELFEKHGMELNDDLTFDMGQVKGLSDKQEKYSIATNVLNDINDSLNLMETGIMGLNQELDNVSTDYLYYGKLDEEDISRHIANPDNKHIFREPEYLRDPDDVTNFALDKNGKRIPIIIDGDTQYSNEYNYLARAFETPEDWNASGKVGFVPQYNASEKADFIKPEAVKMNLNANFAQVKELYSLITSGDDKKDKQWLIDNGLEGFLKLEGAQKLWDNPDHAHELRKNIELKIVGLFDSATSFKGISEFFGYGVSPGASDLRKKIGLIPTIGLDGEPTGDDNQAIYTSSDLLNMGVQEIFDKYIGIQKKYYDEGLGMTVSQLVDERGALKTNIGNGSLFAQEYLDDNIYHSNSVPDSKDFGNTTRDKILYQYLQIWYRLNNSFPGSISH